MLVGSIEQEINDQGQKIPIVELLERVWGGTVGDTCDIVIDNKEIYHTSNPVSKWHSDTVAYLVWLLVVT